MKVEWSRCFELATWMPKSVKCVYDLMHDAMRLSECTDTDTDIDLKYGAMEAMRSMVTTGSEGVKKGFFLQELSTGAPHSY